MEKQSLAESNRSVLNHARRQIAFQTNVFSNTLKISSKVDESKPEICLSFFFFKIKEVVLKNSLACKWIIVLVCF